MCVYVVDDDESALTWGMTSVLDLLYMMMVAGGCLWKWAQFAKVFRAAIHLSANVVCCALVWNEMEWSGSRECSSSLVEEGVVVPLFFPFFSFFFFLFSFPSVGRLLL